MIEEHESVRGIRREEVICPSGVIGPSAVIRFAVIGPEFTPQSGGRHSL